MYFLKKIKLKQKKLYVDTLRWLKMTITEIVLKNLWYSVDLSYKCDYKNER